MPTAKGWNPLQAISLRAIDGEEGRRAGEEGRDADEEDSDSYGSDHFESLEESEGEEGCVVSPVQQLDSIITNEVGASPCMYSSCVTWASCYPLMWKYMYIHCSHIDWYM